MKRLTQLKTCSLSQVFRNWRTLQIQTISRILSTHVKYYEGIANVKCKSRTGEIRFASVQVAREVQTVLAAAVIGSLQRFYLVNCSQQHKRLWTAQHSPSCLPVLLFVCYEWWMTCGHLRFSAFTHSQQKELMKTLSFISLPLNNLWGTQVWAFAQEESDTDVLPAMI